MNSFLTKGMYLNKGTKYTILDYIEVDQLQQIMLANDIQQIKNDLY